MICVSMTATQINAQGPQIKSGTKKDGSPSFQYTIPIENVNFDTTSGIVSLIPTFGFSQDQDSFQFILPVIDSSWYWPTEINLVSPEDIEYYTDDYDTIHYVVTDWGGDKIIDLVLSNPSRAWILEGSIGKPSQTLNNPTDTYVYKENDNPIFLITDEGRHRVIKYDRTADLVLWQYGNGNPGKKFNQLFSPSDAVALPASGQILICDKGNSRVILVNEADTTIAWEWGEGEL